MIPNGTSTYLDLPTTNKYTGLVVLVLFSLCFCVAFILQMCAWSFAGLHPLASHFIGAHGQMVFFSTPNRPFGNPVRILLVGGRARWSCFPRRRRLERMSAEANLSMTVLNQLRELQVAGGHERRSSHEPGSRERLGDGGWLVGVRDMDGPGHRNHGPPYSTRSRPEQGGGPNADQFGRDPNAGR